MKKCPYCAEEVQDEAVVCKHCGRDLKQHKSFQLSGKGTTANPKGNFLTRKLKHPLEKKKTNGQVNPAQVNALCKEVKNTLQSLDLADQKEVLQGYVNRIIIGGRDKVEVWLTIDTKNFPSVKEGLYVEGRHRRPPQRG
jgi:hypothetical protein